MRRLILGAMAGAVVMPLATEAAAAQEIVVTANRARGSGYYDGSAPAPALALRRTADFAVLEVTVTGDTREPAKRRDEIYAMIRGAIGLADKSGLQLATGETVVEPVTLANYRNLPLEDDDDRTDTESTSFLVKVPLGQSNDAKAALDRVTKFVAAVPTVGRAEMKASGDLALTVVNSEQYRGAIIDLVAREAAATAARFGDAYGASVEGLSGRVQWSRASLGEVFLYLPVTFSVQPKD